MSEVHFERPGNANRTSIGQSIEFKMLVGVLFLFSAIVLLVSRLTGAKHETPFLKEAKQAAYAAAGYAFKH